jgi:hypothetical protein
MQLDGQMNAARVSVRDGQPVVRIGDACTDAETCE